MTACKTTNAKRFNYKTIAAYVVAAMVLIAVFAMYLDPDFMLTMADQVWACF